MKQLYKGKAKTIYQLKNHLVLIRFNDDATAGNGVKHQEIVGKGVLNNKISEIVFTYLESKGIDTHFVERVNDRDQICEQVEVIPLEVIVRNFAAGSIVKRLGFDKGCKFKVPTVEFSYKCDALHDPLLNDDHAIALEITKRVEIDHIKVEAKKINEYLMELFASIGMTLVDFKVEFGRRRDGTICLVDEFSPDNCRLWNSEKISFDKDRFRENSGDLIKGYEVIYDLLKGR